MPEARGFILLVEDNPLDLDLTQRAFAKRGMADRVRVARDGEEALEQLSAWAGAGEALPSVILLDLHLPRIGGMDVLTQIRASTSFGSVPVVVMTSSRDHWDMHQARQLGAESYLMKPVSYESFLEVAEQLQLYWIDRPVGRDGQPA